MPRVTITRQDTGETIEIDSTQTVDWSRDYAVTAHPVERGAAITDHTQPLPAEMQISGIVTGLDVQGAGAWGSDKYAAFKRWIESAYSTLWDVVVPGRPGLTDCLVTTLRIGMTMDEFLSVTLGVREVVIVDAAQTADLIVARAGGVSRQKVPAGKPPPKTEADLAPEQQDGAQGTEPGGSLLFNLGQTLGVL